MSPEEVISLRLDLGLSRERFAQLLMVSMQTVRRWEGGSTKPLPFINLRLEELESTVLSLGASLPSPFAALSFLALPVIPELRLTDLGLVDVTAARLLH